MFKSKFRIYVLLYILNLPITKISKTNLVGGIDNPNYRIVAQLTKKISLYLFLNYSIEFVN